VMTAQLHHQQPDGQETTDPLRRCLIRRTTGIFLELYLQPYIARIGDRHETAASPAH
jgi:hypothetical protein